MFNTDTDTTGDDQVTEAELTGGLSIDGDDDDFDDFMDDNDDPEFEGPQDEDDRDDDAQRLADIQFDQSSRSLADASRTF
jgi:hypothetical protein